MTPGSSDPAPDTHTAELDAVSPAQTSHPSPHPQPLTDSLSVTLIAYLTS